MSTEEESQPVPNWLLKLEERREKRLKGKLGHEAGAGAKCQKCEDKCPGLDLHFWRKICKACKCGKEDHDIIDDDIYGYVQFQLLGSKPVKSKGQFLKDRKDEVILEWTPKGSSNDIKKYLEELPADMIPVKGSEGAKIRKQRLQKQMPAHDIDATLCHQLTEDEIKEMEEYVSHIRKNCVGQGKIVRLSLFKGNPHKITPSNSQFLTQIPPAQIASSQTVFLQSSDMANNLHNLSIRDKNPQNIENSQKSVAQSFPKVDNQNPTNVGKITDLNFPPNYYPSGQQNVPNVVHPLTTSNVERHQEQYEIQNANFDRVLNPHLNYAPNYLNPVEQHQLPTQIGQTKDLKYPTGDPTLPVHNANIDKITNPLMQFNPGYIHPVDQSQIPVQVGQPKDIKYPAGGNQNVPRYNNANIEKVTNPLMQYNAGYINPIDQTQIPVQVGQPKDLKYPSNLGNKSGTIGSTENLSHPPPINNATHPLMQRNPNLIALKDQTVAPTHIGGPQDVSYPQNQDLAQNYSIINNANVVLPQYNPNFINPTENVQLASQMGQPKDIKYPSGTQNLDQPVNANLIGQYSNYLGQVDPKFGGQLGQSKDIQNLDQTNPINANLVGQYSNYPGQVGLATNPNFRGQLGQSNDLINPVNANTIGQLTKSGANPNYPMGQTVPTPKIGQSQDSDSNIGHLDLKNKPLIPILEAQNAINPFESHQNLQSVGYLRDIDYPMSTLPITKDNQEPIKDQNSNQPSLKCHSCKEVFDDGCVAISADRTTNLWHSKCFSCETCKQPLADLLYFYHKDTDNIYCGRDYAILKGIPRCLACDELIFVREYCLAEENTFHIKHFCCFECDEPLAGKQYILENNQPVCVACFENLKSENCNDCKLKIRPDQQGVSLQDLHWHASSDCFACKRCRKSLLGAKMLLRNQNLFCSDICFKSF